MKLVKTTSRVHIPAPLFRCIFKNSNLPALSEFQNKMKGKAKDSGFEKAADVTNYIKQLRAGK